MREMERLGKYIQVIFSFWDIARSRIIKLGGGRTADFDIEGERGGFFDCVREDHAGVEDEGNVAQR